MSSNISLSSFNVRGKGFTKCLLLHIKLPQSSIRHAPTQQNNVGEPPWGRTLFMIPYGCDHSLGAGLGSSRDMVGKWRCHLESQIPLTNYSCKRRTIVKFWQCDFSHVELSSFSYNSSQNYTLIYPFLHKRTILEIV